MVTKKFPSALVLLLLSIVALYFGTASLISIKEVEDYNTVKKLEAVSADTVAVIYDGIVFKNKAEMKSFVQDEKYAMVSALFDWSSRVPDFLILIIGACSFGLLGTIIKILYEHIFGTVPLQDSKYLSLPLLGFFSGFISIGVSYLLPNVFLESKSLTNPVGLVLFALFFGFFIKEFFEKIQSKIAQ